MTITYGDTTGGGPGIMMTQTSGARTPFPLYVDLDGAGEWRPLPILPFAVVGTTVAGVHGFAPSVVRPGESFELSVRAEDRFYNRATGDIPGFDVVVGGEVRASTGAGSEAITIVELALDEPGVYWTTLRSRDVEPQITGGANPILVVEDPEYGIYWGDTHGHSGYAEGIGTLDFFLQFARDDARLDFVTHSEHDTALDAGEWELMRAKSAEYDDPGRFIPYLGWEWTLVKNETELWTRDYSLDTGAGAPTELLLTFYSEETPVHMGDAPRGWRHWRGSLTVAGATLRSIEGTDFANPTTQRVEQSGNGAMFRTNTRGETSSLRLSVADVQPGAAIVLELDEAAETGSAPPFYRPRAVIPGGRVRLPLSELRGGRMEKLLPIENYHRDSVTLRRIRLDGPRDLTFTYTDTDTPRQGDYYYVRVRLAGSSAQEVGAVPYAALLKPREIAPEPHRDSVTLRRIRLDGPRDLTFTYTDTDTPRQGDYYYVRVRQLNDAMACRSSCRRRSGSEGIRRSRGRIQAGSSAQEVGAVPYGCASQA